jgi:hypothetical protein
LIFFSHLGPLLHMCVVKWKRWILRA